MGFYLVLPVLNPCSLFVLQCLGSLKHMLGADYPQCTIFSIVKETETSLDRGHEVQQVPVTSQPPDLGP